MHGLVIEKQDDDRLPPENFPRSNFAKDGFQKDESVFFFFWKILFLHQIFHLFFENLQKKL